MGRLFAEGLPCMERFPQAQRCPERGLQEVLLLLTSAKPVSLEVGDKKRLPVGLLTSDKDGSTCA